MSALIADAVTLLPRAAEGAPLLLDEPLSFWGGLDPLTGLIIDRWHPQRSATISGRALMMPAGRGSSSGSASLLLQRDAIVVVGAMVAAELYGSACPVALVRKRDWEALAAAARLAVRAEPGGATISVGL